MKLDCNSFIYLFCKSVTLTKIYNEVIDFIKFVLYFHLTLLHIVPSMTESKSRDKLASLTSKAKSKILTTLRDILAT